MTTYHETEEEYRMRKGLPDPEAKGDTGIHGDGFHFLDILRDRYHNNSVQAGWWKQLDQVKEAIDMSGLENSEQLKQWVEMWYLATKLCLVHSEVSEMMEGLRKGLQDDHLPHRSMEEVEAADVLIRLFDYAGFQGLELGDATYEKGEYNAGRADHKISTREGEGGKKF